MWLARNGYKPGMNYLLGDACRFGLSLKISFAAAKNIKHTHFTSVSLKKKFLNLTYDN